jgi:hypothetical protein
VKFSAGKPRCQGKDDDPTASADIEKPCLLRPAQVAKVLDQLLGLGSRDEGALVAHENVIPEFDRPEQVLQWLASATSPDQLTKRRQLDFGKRSLEFEIELDSLFS